LIVGALFFLLFRFLHWQKVIFFCFEKKKENSSPLEKIQLPQNLKTVEIDLVRN